MKTGRNLPRGRANQENQEDLQRMERRTLGTGMSSDTGNPWDALSQKVNRPTTRGIKQYIHIDWAYLAVLLCLAAAVILFVVLNSANAETLPLFSPGEPHRSSPEYPQYFDTVSASVGRTAASVQQKIFDEHRLLCSVQRRARLKFAYAMSFRPMIQIFHLCRLPL